MERYGLSYRLLVTSMHLYGEQHFIKPISKGPRRNWNIVCTSSPDRGRGEHAGAKRRLGGSERSYYAAQLGLRVWAVSTYGPSVPCSESVEIVTDMARPEGQVIIKGFHGISVIYSTTNEKYIVIRSVHMQLYLYVYRYQLTRRTWDSGMTPSWLPITAYHLQ